MFAAQQRFYEEASEVSAELFKDLVSNPRTKEIYLACKKLYEDYLHMGDKKPYDKEKKKLPMFMYMCTFEPNNGKDGKSPLGKWRCQKGAKLNGLIMLDLDGLPDPMEVYMKIPNHFFEDDCPQQIVFAHLTPSWHGLRLVFKGDPNVGNIADNQEWMAAKLGLKLDDACKDASRGSFIPCEDAILYFDDQLFTYNDERLDKEFGEYYRSGKSAATSGNRKVSGKDNRGPVREVRGQVLAPAGEAKAGSEQGTDVNLGDYDGIPYSDLVQRWLEQNGTPSPGGRHNSLLRMAGDFRYITDYRKLGQVLRLAPYVQEWETDASVTQEIDDIVRDVTARQQYWRQPQRIKKLLESFAKTEEKTTKTDSSWYHSFAQRMKPLLAPPYDVACKLTSEDNMFGAILASGAMFGTLMTRCTYEHYDGNMSRINPQVYIIGLPASGKSFVDRLDKEIMACMRASDEVGREAERRYKEESRERQNSKKAANGDVLKRPEPVIRYIPTRTSNAVFYRRSNNAKELLDGEMTRLHLYSFDSELASKAALKGGGQWIDKHELELKAFANEESGVDFANSESENALIPIFWNTVTTGTEVSLAKLVKRDNILDGLCSRQAIFRMCENKYKMIPKGSHKRNHDIELALKEWGYFFDQQKGVLPLERLVDKVYGLCELSAFEAGVASDDVLDFLRRRAVFYAEWMTIPRIVARLRGKKDAKIEVTDEDLQFAEIIYDAVLYWQDRFYGDLYDRALNGDADKFVARQPKPVKGSEELDKLPDVFTTKEASVVFNTSVATASMRLFRLAGKGYIQDLAKGKWKKGGKV